MPESSPIEFIKIPKAIACRDGLVALYGKIGSSAIRAALCISTKPKDEELLDNRAVAFQQFCGMRIPPVK